MARMHTRRRGTSGSDRPAADEPPEWSNVDTEAIEARIVDLADEGYEPSHIGIELRDSGVDGLPIPDVKLATGKKITTILEEHNHTPEIPTDLQNLMARAVRLHDHMDANPGDHQNKRALQNTESKIRRLVNYYRGDKLDETYTYDVETARELVE